MEVKTKFNTGNKVFFIFNNKIRYDEIRRITVTKGYFSNLIYIDYKLNRCDEDFAEIRLFETKEELLETL